jgi:hypothetical protein
MGRKKGGIFGILLCFIPIFGIFAGILSVLFKKGGGSGGGGIDRGQ